MQYETLENLAVVDVLQSSFVLHTRTHAEHLAKDYNIKKPKEVADFIGGNLFLLEVLEEIPAQISLYFGESQKLALKVSYEPEVPRSSEIWIEILTELSAKEATNLLEKFDENWWLENMDRTDGKLNVALKFI